MNNRNGNGALIFAVILVVILLGAITIFSLRPVAAPDVNGRGGTSNGDSIALGSNLNVGGAFVLGTNGGTVGDSGYNNGLGVSATAGIGTCVGSTTAISLVSPYTSTSTFTVESLVVTSSQPTSTSFVLGTSTKATAGTSADVSTVGGSFSVGSTTNIFLSPGSGGVNPTTGALGSLTRFTVGANEKVLLWATSTATGIGAVNYNASSTTCTLKGTWRN